VLPYTQYVPADTVAAAASRTPAAWSVLFVTDVKQLGKKIVSTGQRN